LAKTSSPLVYIFKLPGLLLQKLTTKEPTDDMIEVAITSFTKVLKMDEDKDEPTSKFLTPEKVTDLLARLKKEFSDSGVDETDAEWIISEVSGIKRSEFGDEKKVVPAVKIYKINDLAKERLSGKPLSYVLKNTNFYGYAIKTDERALIPRPETEELVERAIKSIKPTDRVLDLCTGSGAIAAVVKAKTGAEVTASDISEEALSLAKENFAALNLDITAIASDAFENIDGKFDVIISNPPYIKSGEIASLQPEVKDYEPIEALNGGEDGLKFYRIIAETADKYLKESGKLFLEIGFDEASAVEELLKEKYEVAVYKDISGNDRIVEATLKVATLKEAL
ncbi:MAG: peptide chain release factor N(5)-glutamine methyltransferase, partial [Clostridia bacterium]|nr:peptide chain release factor N(5)-glutamine methyltransferase [Clostridia bacterium]